MMETFRIQKHLEYWIEDKIDTLNFYDLQLLKDFPVRMKLKMIATALEKINPSNTYPFEGNAFEMGTLCDSAVSETLNNAIDLLNSQLEIPCK